MSDLSAEQQGIIDKVEKLLRLAGRNPSEAEAASAMAKAQEILAAYNLDIGTVEANGTEGRGRREDAKQRGGMYEYQRELYSAVAQLNFCLHFTYRRWREREVRDYRREDGTWRMRAVGGYVYETRLVGRRVNVLATQQMFAYISGTIERLTRERLHERDPDRPNTQLWSRWAVSFREGIAEKVVDKVRERRQLQLTAEQEAARAASERAMSGASTATSLTLASLARAEEDANQDFIHGEGYSARRREQRARAADAARREEADYTRWAEEHPKEARAEAERAERRAAREGCGPAAREKDWGAYRAGREAGEAVGIDPQAEGDSAQRRRIGRG